MVFNRRFFKLCGLLIVILFFLHVTFIILTKKGVEDVSYVLKKSNIDGVNHKISWEPIDFINYEKTRFGLGEDGKEVIITNETEIKVNEEWLAKEGFYVDLSKKLSLTRSLPERRPEVCQTFKYYERLPNVSVIVCFHNEIFTTLLRCIHSIYNRSPKQLLHEIVIVNDNSTFPELYEPLRTYLKHVFGSKITLVENKERQGLIKARSTGAKIATGDVIVFLDSHMEVYNGWLPPLLDPLVTKPTYATVPIVDGMDAKTFRPVHVGYGYRGMFDWNFRYQWIPLRPIDRIVEGAPFDLPAMTGGAYAIRRNHFFYLGGYDEELLIWNGENYEIGLKLWLCGGGILKVPCSRATHLSKHHSAYRNTEKPMDFVGRNLKRVAEVWLDEYKQYFYRGDQKRYDNINPGDLTKQFAKKESLNCKPFKYYLEEIAPDMLLYYPIEPTYFATGEIESKLASKCLGMPTLKYGDPIALVDCGKFKGTDFTLTLEKSIRYNDTNDQCLNEDRLKLSNCHHQGGGQYFRFDLNTRQIINPPTNRCLMTENKDDVIFMATCDPEALGQKWSWKYENQTALMNFFETGIKRG